MYIDRSAEKLTEEAVITGLENPNSTAQLKRGSRTTQTSGEISDKREL
ncbi:MAG: hypothetical protein V8S75_02745 [[Ruminococcus] torques]